MLTRNCRESEERCRKFGELERKLLEQESVMSNQSTKMDEQQLALDSKEAECHQLKSALQSLEKRFEEYRANVEGQIVGSKDDNQTLSNMITILKKDVITHLA